MEAELWELFGFIRFMLKINPECRPSAEEVLQHPWFTRGETAQRVYSGNIQ